MSEKENKKKAPDTIFDLNDAAGICAGGEGGENPAMRDDPAADPSSLAGELGRLRAEKAELMRTMVMRQADFENYKKRIERERQEERAAAAYLACSRTSSPCWMPMREPCKPMPTPPMRNIARDWS